MSIQQISLFPLPLAIHNINGQTQPISQEEQTLDVVIQTLAIIESQNSAIQAEYAAALQQAQNTLSELQKNQRQLLQHNSILAAQNIVLQSQYNQSEKIHQVDQTAAQERISVLEEALREKSLEVNILQKAVAVHEKGLTDIEALLWTMKIGHISPAACKYRASNTIQETKKQIANLSQGT